MSEACIALDMPIVSGNVSLYNETKNEDGTGSAILPTPAIGAVGVIEDVSKAVGIGFKANRQHIMLIGHGEGHLGGSTWLQEIMGRREGPPPPVDLELERRTGEFVRALIAEGAVTAVHDVADGGLAVTVAEMALAGNIGADVTIEIRGPSGCAANAFGEDQGLYVVTTESDSSLKARAKKAGLVIDWIGITGGDSLRLKYYDGPPQICNIPLADLRAAHEGFFPALMGADGALA